MIKAIIFDFFGVICSDEYWKIVKADKDLDSDFSRLANQVNLGKISWLEFVTKIAQETGQNIEQVQKMYEAQRVDTQILAFIQNLRTKYKTALLTNASYDYFEKLAKEAHLDKVFNEIVVSSLVGIIKPDPRIYQYTLSKLGVKPEEAVFIDDISKHIYGAQQVGLKTIHYKEFGQMKTELVRLLDKSA